MGGRRSVAEYLDYFERYGARTAYVSRRGYRSDRWSYREVLETARGFARHLESRHVGKGDHILLWCENSPAWAALFWGGVLSGAVLVPMDQGSSPEFVERVAQQTDPKLIIASRQQPRIAGSVPVLLMEQLPELLEPAPGDFSRRSELKPQDHLQVIFTSGTTAAPKGVVITHENILSNLDPIEREVQKYLKYERIVHPLRFLVPLPLSHVFGQFLALFVPPLLGGTVFFQQSLNPSEILRRLSSERISVLGCVPRVGQALREKIERDFESQGRLDWFRGQLRAADGEHFLKRWWRFRDIHRRLGWKFWAFVVGGAALDEATEKFWTRLGFLVMQGYGLTETASLISINHPLRPSPRSIGTVLPGYEMKLDENGEILVRGKSVAAGYWSGRQMQPVRDEAGWFRTGDIGEVDEKGNLFFKGRKKDVIVTPEGMNVYPEDLEQALREQPEVRDCVVVGLPRGGNAEACAVLILREPGQEPEPVIRNANRSLPDYQRLRRWLVWPEVDFPRGATQKPLRFLIQQQAVAEIEGEARAKVSAGPLAQIIARVTGCSAREFAESSRLGADLNLSSIEQVELMSEIEDRYQIDLDESRFTAAKTVRDLENLLHNPPAGRPEYVYPRWQQRWPFTWIRTVAYYLLIWPATLLLGYPRVKGKHHLREVHGVTLLICNHIAFFDPGLLMAALPWPFRHRLAIAMEGERLRQMRRPPVEWSVVQRWMNRIGYHLAVLLFNVFPLPQRSGFRDAFAFAGVCVDRGYHVLIFPEGRRTPNGQIQEFRSGIGLLSNNLNLAILPMRIDGLWELRQAGKRMARPGRITILIGPPVKFAPDSDPKEVAQKLQEIVGGLGRS